LSKSQLRSIPRLPLPETSANAVRLFKISARELALVSRLWKKFQPKRSLRRSALRGRNAKLGFMIGDVMRAK
ncbi:Hypothetical predicted protein, partial [Paramuricea clavata]